MEDQLFTPTTDDYLAVYANIAYDNFMRSFNAFYGQCFKKSKCKNEENCIITTRLNDFNSDVNKLFDPSNPIPEFEKHFLHHFPLFSLLSTYKSDNHDTWLDLYKDYLLDYAAVINHIRNRYTHYYYSKKMIDVLRTNCAMKQFVAFFSYVREESIRSVGQRFGCDIKQLRSKMKDAFFIFGLDDDDCNWSLTIFLISLSLNREDTNLFLQKMSVVSQFKYPKLYRLFFESYSFYSIRMVKNQLNMDKSNDALAMDIIQELSKVPIEVFNHLSDGDRMAYTGIDNSSVTDVYESGYSRIRHVSRFEHLVLRYLSTLPQFPGLCFYTYFGKYVSRCYDKLLIDGKTEKRFVTAPVVGFCRDVNYADITCLQYLGAIPRYKNPESMTNQMLQRAPYVLLSHPHYIINDNKIGIKFVNEGEIPMVSSLKEHVDSLQNVQPDYWLSVHELPALLFWVLKNPSKNSEALQYVMQKSLKSSISKQSVRSNDFLRELLLVRLKRELIKLDMQLNQVKDSLKNVKLTNGRMAAYLAKDMIRLQPSKNNGRDKLTGANFQALQRALAYYHDDGAFLEPIFRRSYLVGGNHEHPFLGKMLPLHYSSLSLFYIAYLEHRQCYINSLQKKCVKNQVLPDVYFCRDLLKTSCSNVEPASQKPVFLPRGFLSTQLGLQQLNGCKHNCAYLIRQEYSSGYQDWLQPFYVVNRSYSYFDNGENYKVLVNPFKNIFGLKKLKNKYEKLDKPNINVDLNVNDRQLRKQYSRFTKNEDHIREKQVQDILLLEVVKRLLPNIFTPKSPLNLSALDNLLGQSTSFSLSLSNNNVNYNVIMDGVQYRDYGKLAYYCNYDLQIIPFCKVLSQGSTVHWNDLQSERQKFKKCQVQVLALVHRFERQFVTLKQNMIISESFQDNGYYSFKELIESLKTIYHLDSSDCTIADSLVTIRNKFCHCDWLCDNDLVQKHLVPDLHVDSVFHYFELQMNRFLMMLDGPLE